MHLDPADVAAEAYRQFPNGGCMYGLFAGIMRVMAKQQGERYLSFPLHMMKYGEGGVGLWGSLCGTLTGGFPTKFEEQQLLDAFATPCTEKVMKQLQDGKLVFICVQNDKTKSNDAALQGIREFKADARFASAAEIVMLDPADPAEASFMADLKIDPKTEEAVTAFLAPPGSAIAEYKGATDKSELIATLQRASSGCCPGGSCGPGGCAPKP